MTCCVAASSAVFGGHTQVVCACLRRPAGGLRQLASRAAREACCTSPLEFSGDKRGRLREIFPNVVNHIPPSLNFGPLRFSAGPMQWGYDGSARRPAGATSIQSARIALPDPASVVSLSDWLPKSMAQSFNAPAATDKPIAPKFFNVSVRQWRAVVRRMVRSKLAVALPGDTCSIQLAGGVFAVPKDEARDRLISGSGCPHR